MASEPTPPLSVRGDLCFADTSKTPHVIESPDDDADLMVVYAWLRSHDLRRLFTRAVISTIDYVLDGARTGRFDIQAPEVDSDERRTVGTKLQYHVLEALDLVKEPPLDTRIAGIPVEIKATIHRTWMIPREGQCQITMLFQIDPARSLHRALLMRTHRAWLAKGNQDKKRSIRMAAPRQFALPLLDWTPFPRSPLTRLTPEQRAEVFAPRVGQAKRLTALFGYLPEVVIPRSAIETVCARNRDPMRRARQAKELVLEQHGLYLLCGRWTRDREEAARRGFDISDDAWVAVRP